MSIILTLEQENFVKEKLKTGRYQSIDQVITEAFHLLEQQSQKQPVNCGDEQLSWDETYQEMAQEKEDWSEWDITLADELEEDINLES
ncbi:MAG: type II toxin-antitoxin system ParD family antitoxin [Crocosphaera sp.]